MNKKIILLSRVDVAQTKQRRHVVAYENATCHTIYMCVCVSASVCACAHVCAPVHVINEKAPC